LLKDANFAEFKALIDTGTVDVNTPPPKKDPLLKAAVNADKNEFVK
jgi:ankyrin repeat protein